MANASSIIPNSGPSSAASAVRARPLPRSHLAEIRAAREQTGERLRAVLDAVTPRCTLAEVARAWGDVDDRVVRNVLDGSAPLTSERMDALPDRVQEQWYESRLVALRERRECRAFVPPPPASAALLHSEAKGVFDGELARAMADGNIDDGERRTLIPLASRCVDSAVLQRRAIEGAK